MKRVMIICLFVLMSGQPLISRDPDNVKYIAELLAKDPEELSEDEILHFQDLLKKPLGLNNASRERLAGSGLFTRYQIASILDYKMRSGQIFSFMELAAIDGFGEDLVDKLRPFISLEQVADLEGKTDHEITTRTALRSSSGNTRFSYAARYKVRTGERLNASVAFSRSLDSKTARPDAYCASLGMRFRRIPARLILGDFNVRYGQGMALWSGTDFSSLNDPSTFLRRSSGISTTSSFTGSEMLTGAAAELNLNRFNVSIVAGARGLKTILSRPEKLELVPAMNLSYAWRYGQVGLSQVALERTSCDLSACYRGIDLFSELVYDWVERKPAGLAGVVAPLGEKAKIAAMLRSKYPEHLFAVSGSFSDRKRISGTFSSNVTLYSEPKVKTQDRSLQVKLHTQWQFACCESLMIRFRATERIRSWGEIFRTDLRSDIAWQSEPFNITLRLNMLNCKNTSFLTYIEGGFKNGKLSIYLRQGFFLIDDWDDRIYVYERDAPGCYNSPAFYGRGEWTSFMASWKPSHSWKLYFRAGYTSYPFMKEKKPGKAELRLQVVFDF